MKLGIFTTITNPEGRGDNYKDAVACYNDLADVVTIIDGDDTWPKEFDWPLIGEHFQKGYEQCDADWVIHMDIDWLFHEKDFGRIRQALRDYPTAPAVSFYKWQFLVPDRYNLKSRLVMAVNKKVYGDRIKFNSGGDLCQPSLDGRELQLDEMPQAGVAFYNYEKLTKTKKQITDDVERMDRAWKSHFGTNLYSTDDITAYQGWLKMMIGRLSKPHAKIRLDEHPKYIQLTLKDLKPDQWGYDGFGLVERNSYA